MSQNHQILSNHSYEELESSAEWFELYGPIPTIIGGWAVYFYNPYYGSVDIDLVGPSMGGSFMKVLTDFEVHNGYEEYFLDNLGFIKSYRKNVVDNMKQVGYIIIDACTYEENIGEFKEDFTKKLPFELCDEYKTELTLQNDKPIVVPQKELLLLYKLKAFRDRSYYYNINRGILSPSDATWIEGKIIKDGSDVLALLDDRYNMGLIPYRPIDHKIIKELLNRFSLHFILKSFDEITSNDRCLNLYRGTDLASSKAWVNTLIQKIT